MSWRRFLPIGAALLTGFLAGFVLGRLRDVPFVERHIEWSIGIYTGASPLLLGPSSAANPVITAADVTDAPASSVADPFMVRNADGWFMFFEAAQGETGQGDIALATSDDALGWTYQRIVLDEPFHLSYPFVFEWEGDYYMVPESQQAFSLRLYRAVEFPHRWEFVATLMTGMFVDPTVVRHNGTWFLFASTKPYRDETLSLYYADDLTGPWTEHPQSPIIEDDARVARPAGRFVNDNGRLLRLAQDSYYAYGRQVWAFEITQLDKMSYSERRVGDIPVVGATSWRGWNRTGMHHVDAHRLDDGRWIACVDGYRKSWSLSRSVTR